MIVTYFDGGTVMLEIYCGNGKGKTTAAIGLAVRAAGAGMKVAFIQFLKNGSSSEIEVLKSIGNITVRCCEECRTFVSGLDESEISAVTDKHNDNLRTACDMIRSGNADIVILDEFIGAFNKNLLDRKLALDIIGLKDRCEIVITGRSPDEMLLSAADYVSEINAVRHPFEKGVTARKGIEY